MQYEQYEQEMQHLQELIEGAHREIEDKPVATSNIQELQAQISRHEVRREHRRLLRTYNWFLGNHREKFSLSRTQCAQLWGSLSDCLCILSTVFAFLSKIPEAESSS